jgi:hypothetical protein|tara:strand:+ start:6747 stop:7316 length:570 start_codon:yes stop_codon:yes gene_type:complete
MKLTGSFEIKLDKNSVWKALNNPEILKKCIPGCEEFKKKSDINFTAAATNKIGPVNASFTGDIELQDLNPPDSYKIIGKGNSPVGIASGEALVQLEENNGITKLTYNVQANVGGKIAQIGSRLIDMTAKKMADIFFGRFLELLSPPETKKDLKAIPKDRFDFNQINKKWAHVVIMIVVIIAIYLAKNFF